MLHFEELESRHTPTQLLPWDVTHFWGPLPDSSGPTISTQAFPNWSAIGPAIALVPGTAGPLANVSVVDFGTTIYSGPLNVLNTINRIRANGNTLTGNDGDVYNNNNGLLPAGSWYEFVVHPTSGTNMSFSVSFPGPMRLLLDTEGDLYFTGDHYSSFTPVYLQPSTTTAIVAWDVNGQTNYGTQNLAATTVTSGVTASLGLTRGAGVTTVNTAALNAWGGNGWGSNAVTALMGNQTASFGVTVAAGRTLSLTSIDLTYRRSSAGPAGGLWQYQLNSGAWTTISDHSSLFSSTSTSGAVMPPLNLSSITALQDLQAGSTVNFRVAPYAPSSSGGTWYVFDTAGNDLVLNGTVRPAVTAVSVNGGNAQRSRITSVGLTFGAPVDASTLTALGAITLTRTAGGPATLVQTAATGANGRITVSPATGLVTAVTLSFSNANSAATTAGVEYGSLADGRWQLSVPSLRYASPFNDVNLRRAFGDSNADGNVSGADFLVFGNAFNGPSVAFDFNNSGVVDGSDLLQFGNRFGVTI